MINNPDLIKKLIEQFEKVPKETLDEIIAEIEEERFMLNFREIDMNYMPMKEYCIIKESQYYNYANIHSERTRSISNFFMNMFTKNKKEKENAEAA